MNTFQIVILGVFGVALVIAVLIFSGFIPTKGDRSDLRGTVTIWGTLEQELIFTPLEELNRENDRKFIIEYIEIRRETFDRDLVEALASGTGPDMILLPQDLILRHKDKVLLIPYETMSVRDFQNTFIEEGELYLSQDGIVALPFSLDPLVMYWNRDLFSSAAIAQVPQFWDELFTLGPRITQIDQARNIRKSIIAFGEYRNVNHAKEILALLMLQAGDSIIQKNNNNDDLIVTLGEQQELVTPPSQSALRFYTEFSNSAKPFYSWNRSLPNAKDFFIRGDLALYIGFASERKEIKEKSPHLNFDVALMPQARDSARKTTYGKMVGVAVLKSSTNIPTAFFASFQLTGRDFSRQFSERASLPSVRRELLSRSATTAHQQVFNDSALISRAWFDPSPRETESIFKDMIENVVSGRLRLSDAIVRAQKELTLLLK